MTYVATKDHDCHLFSEVGVLDSHVCHLLPLLQYLLEANEVQALRGIISINIGPSREQG